MQRVCSLQRKTNNHSNMNTFQDHVFRAKVDDALKTVRTILDTTKHPGNGRISEKRHTRVSLDITLLARPADVPHAYDDKYSLVEQALKASIVATLNAAEVLGASGDALAGMQAWAADNKVRRLQ